MKNEGPPLNNIKDFEKFIDWAFKGKNTLETKVLMNMMKEKISENILGPYVDDKTCKMWFSLNAKFQKFRIKSLTKEMIMDEIKSTDFFFDLF